MADVTIAAAFASVDEDEGVQLIGFPADEEGLEGYVLFQQAIGQPRAPVWLEVNDENFGAEDAIEAIKATPKGFEITIKPAFLGRFGMARTIGVSMAKDCEGRDEALRALVAMLPDLWVA